MTKFEHTVVINRPVEEVWAYLMDAGNDPVWQRPILEVRHGAGETLEVGSTVTEVAQFLGRRFELSFVVTELQPPYRSAVQATPGPVRLSGTYELAEVQEGTRFTMTAVVEGHGFFKIAEPAFARMVRRDGVSTAETLKDVLENAPVPAS